MRLTCSCYLNPRLECFMNTLYRFSYIPVQTFKKNENYLTMQVTGNPTPTEATTDRRLNPDYLV